MKRIPIHGTNSRCWVFVETNPICHCCGRRLALSGLSKILPMRSGVAKRLSGGFSTAVSERSRHMGALNHCWMIWGVSSDAVIHIPFQGRARSDDKPVCAGNADFVFNPLPTVLGPVESGQCARSGHHSRSGSVSRSPRRKLKAGYPALAAVIGWFCVWAEDLDAEGNSEMGYHPRKPERRPELD